MRRLEQYTATGQLTPWDGMIGLFGALPPGDAAAIAGVGTVGEEADALDRVTMESGTD